MCVCVRAHKHRPLTLCGLQEQFVLHKCSYVLYKVFSMVIYLGKDGVEQKIKMYVTVDVWLKPLIISEQSSRACEETNNNTRSFSIYTTLFF